MDNQIRQEMLHRVIIQPSFLKSLIKYELEYDLDYDFYKVAVIRNINCYYFIPDEYKELEEIVNIVLYNASTTYLDFPYNKLKIYNNDQKNAIERIYLIKCYINFYKIIYGEDRIFEDELLFRFITLDNPIFTDINNPLESLDEDEKEYIMYRYGLKDGIIKSIPSTSKHFHRGNNKIYELEKSSMKKLKKYIKENSNRFGLKIR